MSYIHCITTCEHVTSHRDPRYLPKLGNILLLSPFKSDMLYSQPDGSNNWCQFVFPISHRYFINDTVVARTVRTIRPGEEVTENYGPCFITSGKKERRRALWEQFWFECECVACVQDWPTFDKLSSDGVRFRCEHCGAYICQVDENMGLLFKCGRCSKSVNILKSLKSLQDSDSKYKQALDFIEKGDESNGLGILLENIALLDRHLMPPLRDLHLCQENVRRCLLNCGNQISKLSFWDPEKL